MDKQGMRSWTMSVEEAQRLDALDFRAAFGQVVTALGQDDPDLTVVVSDYGRRLGLDEMRRRNPESVVQCGIAEQNQVEVAAALANEGFTVLAPSYVPFITARVLDQVRVNLGMMESPVVLVGLGGGFTAGQLGASHMGLEDLAALRAIPGLAVVCPADNAQAALVLRELAASPRPAYVRLTTGRLAEVASQEGTAFALGHARTLMVPPGGGDPEVAFVACGTMCGRVMLAAQELEQRGIRCEVIDMATIKPLDTAAMDRVRDSRLVVTVEEHSLCGGLGGAVAEYLCSRGGAPRLLRLGTSDRYLEADDQERLLERVGLTVEGIVRQVGAALRGR